MFKRSTILLLILTLLPVLLFAQKKALLKPGGAKVIYLNKNQDPKEVFGSMVNKTHEKLKLIQNTKAQKYITDMQTLGTEGLPDTLSNDGYNWDSRFGAFGQDVLVGWFVCESDLIIKAVGFDCGDNDGKIDAEVVLYKIGNGWDIDKLKRPGALNLGYWISKGNGFNDITPFERFATEPKTWVAHNPGEVSPFAEDIWSDEGIGAPIKPDPDVEGYQWVEMNLLQEPTLKKGEIFAICVKNDDPVFNTNRFGIYASTEAPAGIFKFYANGRTDGDTTTAGWWMREFIFDMVAAVEIIGDQPPTIDNVTELPTTLSTETRKVEATITDLNPSGGPAGVASAILQYFISGGDSAWIDVPMTASGDIYSATLPGEVAPTEVNYKIKATDVEGNTTETNVYSYKIFAPSGVPTLIVFNGYSEASVNNLFDYYFPVPFKNDVWAYGGLSAELLNNYKNVIEITTTGPNYINSDEIRTWLGTSSTNNYMLIGDEWLGAQTNWTETTYKAGDFQYDILGVQADSNDINYAASGDQQLPSLVFPMQGSKLGDSLYAAVTAAGEDSLLYNPYYELGVSNWLDGLYILNDVEVDYKAKSVLGDMFPIGVHRTLPAGNKIIFLSFDPLCLDANPPYTNENYAWYGNLTVAPHLQALSLFDITTDVVDDITSPKHYKLSQNYPNPFNPATKIRYTIPEAANVSIVVYDMLGKEVTRLVNGYQTAGNHVIDFKASNLSSGLYIYKLTAGNFTASKKMMLIK